MNALPDKPSELIRVALADLEKCEKDPDYEIFMGVWHSPKPAGYCEVCLAGAVIAKTLGSDKGESIAPYDYYPPSETSAKLSSDTSDKLSALDKFRTGNIWDGLSCMILPLRVLDAVSDISDRSIPDYHLYPDKFKSSMLELADFFEEQEL